jgi:hypothetical protein
MRPANGEVGTKNRFEDELAENARIEAIFSEGSRSPSAIEALRPLNPGLKNL